MCGAVGNVAIGLHKCSSVAQTRKSICNSVCFPEILSAHFIYYTSLKLFGVIYSPNGVAVTIFRKESSLHRTPTDPYSRIIRNKLIANREKEFILHVEVPELLITVVFYTYHNLIITTTLLTKNLGVVIFVMEVSLQSLIVLLRLVLLNCLWVSIQFLKDVNSLLPCLWQFICLHHLCFVDQLPHICTTHVENIISYR